MSTPTPFPSHIKECSASKRDRVLADPAASAWLKGALLALAQVDPVKAANDAELLYGILCQSCDERASTPDASTMPAGYELFRSVSGCFRWRFEVNGKCPVGQASHWSHDEARQAAWDHWTREGNRASRAAPSIVGHDNNRKG